MATSKVQITEGSGVNAATNTISEDAVTKFLQRIVINDSTGTEVVPLTTTDFDSKTGSLTETAPATDTASSGLNGRLQRIAQRLTTLIAVFPTTLDTNSGNKSASTLRFVLATDQPNLTTALNTGLADGASVTLGSKADAKSTATDTTSITIMQVLKQISASVQAPPSQAVTNVGTFAVQASEADGANVTLGSKADAKSTATDTTSITIMQVLKQISASVQAPPSQAVTNAGTFAVQAASAGDVAHDGVDSGNPVKIGGKAVSSETTAVSAGDRTNLVTDLVGKLITLPYANPENFVSGAITSAMTGTTSTSLVAAPAAGLRNYITTIICSNAHATVGTDIVIQDGSGGTTLLTIPAAAVYGGAVITLPTPLRQPTTATAIYCANVTTGASTKVSAVGYKGV